MPADFFRDMLPRIVNADELKIVLCVAWLSRRNRQPGARLSELRRPDIVRLLAPATSPEPAEERLRQGLNRSVANGHVLRLTIQDGDAQEQYFVVATRDGRERVEALGRRDRLALEHFDFGPGAHIALYRPNVFAVYEQHIGQLTPLVAEELRDAERSYPVDWIEEAIVQAVRYGKRNWPYVRAILTQWEASGGPAEVSGRDA
ncbi:MAG: hypothetical protein NVS2B16_20130 [Chloroflexota bacterium]